VLAIRATAQHAAVRCDADERQRLEQLCRTITRPALANERVQINSAGQVVPKFKTAWRDGTTHIVMSPLEFMQSLAARANKKSAFQAPVPRPRLHLICFHGVLAPYAKLRAPVVTHVPEQATGKSELTATEPGCACIQLFCPYQGLPYLHRYANSNTCIPMQHQLHSENP
jgi:hypothetical protein